MIRYKVGMCGASILGTGVGEHIANISRRLPNTFEIEILSNFLLRRHEAWAFEPFPTLLFAMGRSRHDIIHSHNESAFLLRMKTASKTVTTVHLHPQRVIEEYLKEVSLNHERFNPLYLSKLLINRVQWDRMLKLSDRIIATCRSHIAILSRLHHLPPERFQYIPNGVDSIVFAPRARKKKIQGLFVGNESWRKGIRYLLDAFKTALPELPELKLAIVSRSIPATHDPDLSRSVRVYRHVTFDQLIELYSESSFFVLPTLAEGTPLVMLESMSCATPVIAFAVDGIKDVITHGFDGILVPPRDVKELAKGILRLAGDGSYAGTMGMRARETAIRYDWAKIADKTAQVYYNLIGDAC